MIILIYLCVSILALVNGLQQLFAVIGATQCAENLYYGPQPISKSGSADGQRSYYLSTATSSKNIPHTDWIQVVTSDGTTELFRIYWTFSTARTLAEHFSTAVSSGVSVSYRIVDTANGGTEYYKSGIWRFSTGSRITTSTFNVATTTCCFSSDDGAWGAGSGTIQPDGASNNYYTTSFWGIGNWDSADSSDCGKVYRDGALLSYYPSSKTYMYYEDNTGPSALPTAVPSRPTPLPTAAPSSRPTTAPTQRPTAAPTTLAPTKVPTLRPTSSFPQTLFAVVGGSSCAEDLYYGPQSISTAGSADNQYPYFLSTSTVGKDVAHKEWLQIVTSDGSTELFRIYWTFSTAKTLADRFQAAVSSGEPVIYEVHDAASGQVYTYSGTWWFSNGAGSMGPRFTATTTQCCFSDDDGAWGAGSGTVQANGNVESSFWGVGNWNSADSQCSHIYKLGTYTSYGSSVKVYMYYYADLGPTLAPTTSPASVPASVPTVAPTSSSELFAVVGGSNCAESLYYGPQAITKGGSADGKYPYFLSTTVSSNSVAHKEWLQIVTSDGSTELFRIYWTFSTAKTLADRFQAAVSTGETVSWRVVDSSGAQYTYSATWRYSNGAGSMSPRFATSTTQCCFSSDDGAWGAGTSTVDGNGAMASAFWGIGNFDSSDSTCSIVYNLGSIRASSGWAVKVYMYAVMGSQPPAMSPTLAPVSAAAQTLFAVVGGSNCAESLYYGPQAITTAGASNGQQYFLSTSTAGKDIPHKEWLQIVTSDGTTELFRIYWTFSTAKTLADRFQAAVSSGEYVTYTVEDAQTGSQYTYTGTWWFSNGAGSMSSRFTTTTTQCCFSDDDGAWGGGLGTINGNGAVLASYWGIGNFDSGDSACSTVYRQGVASSYGSSVKAYMYYSTTARYTLRPTARPTPRPPTNQPTAMPSAAPDQIRLQASQDISGVSYSDYQTNQAVYDSVLQQTIVDSMSGIFLSGISRSSFHDFLVTAGSSRRALSEASSLRSPAGSSDPASLSSSTAASIRAQYRLVLTGTGRSYDDVRTQLEGAVQSGSFDAFLRSNALAQGATGLRNATSGSINVQEETDYSSDDDSSSSAGVFTLPVIIGVAGGAGALLVIAFLFYFRARCSVSEQLPSTATAGSDSVETPHRLKPTHLDPSAAMDISQYFYGGGLGQQPRDQAIVPSAPPDTSDCGIELGTTIGSDDHHYEPSNSSAPTLDSIYPHHSNSPSIPVAAVAVPVSAYGPYMPGESVVFAQVYTGEIEEAKD